MIKIHIVRLDKVTPFCGNPQIKESRTARVFFETIEPPRQCKTCVQNYKKENPMINDSFDAATNAQMDDLEFEGTIHAEAMDVLFESNMQDLKAEVSRYKVRCGKCSRGQQESTYHPSAADVKACYMG